MTDKLRDWDSPKARIYKYDGRWWATCPTPGNGATPTLRASWHWTWDAAWEWLRKGMFEHALQAFYMNRSRE